MKVDWRGLREKYPSFAYSGFEYSLQDNQLVMYFNYEISKLEKFRHELIVRNVDAEKFNKLDKGVLDNIIFHIGLVMSLSYWKLTCPKNFYIKAGYLTPGGIDWFSDLFYKGMGQYFFENKINFRENNFLEIKNIKDNDKFIEKALVRSGKVLIPFSGGKDSTVTLNILKDKFDIGTLLVYPQTFAAYDIANLINRANHEVESKIDHKLIDFNEKGYLNGHTPYSAHLILISLLVAYIFDYGYVAFSNEAGSDEGNTVYLNHKINHQYSKSWEYEKIFSNYNEKFLSNIKIFSFLRPLLDIQISRLFSKYPKYFNLIRSCNMGQREGVWCGSCAKCLSTYILFSPFISRGKLVKMFGKDLFEDKALTKLFDSLIGDVGIKPFECVGTRNELKVAMQLNISKNRGQKSHLLKHFKSKYNGGVGKDFSDKLINSWNQKNNVPQAFEDYLKKQYV